MAPQPNPLMPLLKSTNTSVKLCLIPKDLKNLDAIELEQYEILLEDQAFPFEAKAIEFYETNLGRIKDGAYNNWIEKKSQSAKDTLSRTLCAKRKN